MDAERWLRIKELFAEARQRPAAERPAFLAEQCGTDGELRAELESLLAADVVDAEILERPAAQLLAGGNLASDESDARASRWVGRRIGAYEIVGLVGRGGMGDVFRARRADGSFDREVAVKLARIGFDTGFVLNRFEAERRILAGLVHPGIAQLIDGGATEDGLPFIVMELVDGEPIDRYCDSHALDVAARLALFREVCAAVSYAHRHLVVHRDLKPANILVTATGAVRLLDFGIAKLLAAAPGGSEADATVTAFTALTPAYASPEQLHGLPVTTASDVYSLGVVLYRLLAGRSPYGSRPTTAAAALDTILRGDPVAPGAIVAAGGAPPGIAARLDRDLDAIVLKALRKEPERRYASVEHMADDLRRYLNNLPVLARGDEFGYRAGKFVRRHRAWLTAGALGIAVLVGAVVVTSHEARVAERERVRAERHFAAVRKLANKLMFQINDAIDGLPGATAAQQQLLGTALEYLDGLARDATGDLDLRTELAAAYAKVGSIQGAAFQRSLGKPKDAIESYTKAIDLWRSVAAARPANAADRESLAPSLLARGQLRFVTGDRAGAIADVGEATQLLVAAAAQRPGDAVLGRRAAAACTMNAYTQVYTGRAREAVATARDCVARLEKLHDAFPDDAELTRGWSVAHNVLGLVYGNQTPAENEANLAANRRALEIIEAVAARHAGADTRILRDIAVDHMNMGIALFHLGDLGRAEAEYRTAYRGYLEVARDAHDAAAAVDAAYGGVLLGWLLARTGRCEEAQPLLDAGLATLDAHGPEAVVTLQTKFWSAIAWIGRGICHEARASRLRAAAARPEWQAAESAYRDAVRRFEDVSLSAELGGNDLAAFATAREGAARAAMAVAGRPPLPLASSAAVVPP